VRSVLLSASLALALAAPAAAQDRAQERRSLGADSLFGPGIVDLSANGSAVKLRLTRPAHVVAIELGAASSAGLVLPRRPETRLSRAGDQWIDLPRPVLAGGEGRTTTTFRVGRVDAAAGLPPQASLGGGALPGAVTLVIVSDSAWRRETISGLLPRESELSPMALAHALAAALIGGRSDTCAAYLVRW